MGFLDSLFKSAVNKTVNEVVGKVVDQAMDSIGNQINGQSNTQPVQPQAYSIARPSLVGKYHEDDTFIDFDPSLDNGLITFTYELADWLFEYDTGASEIPSCFAVVRSKDELSKIYDDAIYKLPMVYFQENSEFDKETSRFKNLSHKKVVGHQLIEDRYEYIDPKFYNSHTIAYKFYASQANRQRGIAHILTVSYQDNMDKELVNHALQAFELIASTLAKK